MDPTLLGRRWRWYIAGCVVYPLSFHLLTRHGSLLPVPFGSYVPLVFIACFILGTLYVSRWHRRIAKQAKNMDFRMCQFCGYDLRSIDEPGPCPECGRKFEVADLRDYWERKFEGRS